MTWTATAWCLDPGRSGTAVAELAASTRPSWWTVYWRDRFALSSERPSDLDASIAGSAFGSTGELRWRLDGSQLHVVVLLDDDHAESRMNRHEPEPLGDLGEGRRLSDLEASGTTEWHLSGVYDADRRRWTEGRFPRPFDYDVAQLAPMEGARLRLHATELLDRGSVAFQVLNDVTVHGPEE